MFPDQKLIKLIPRRRVTWLWTFGKLERRLKLVILHHCNYLSLKIELLPSWEDNHPESSTLSFSQWESVEFWPETPFLKGKLLPENLTNFSCQYVNSPKGEQQEKERKFEVWLWIWRVTRNPFNWKQTDSPNSRTK